MTKIILPVLGRFSLSCSRLWPWRPGTIWIVHRKPVEPAEANPVTALMGTAGARRTSSRPIHRRDPFLRSCLLAPQWSLRRQTSSRDQWVAACLPRFRQ